MVRVHVELRARGLHLLEEQERRDRVAIPVATNLSAGVGGPAGHRLANAGRFAGRVDAAMDGVADLRIDGRAREDVAVADLAELRLEEVRRVRLAPGKPQVDLARRRDDPTRCTRHGHVVPGVPGRRGSGEGLEVAELRRRVLRSLATVRPAGRSDDGEEQADVSLACQGNGSIVERPVVGWVAGVGSAARPGRRHTVPVQVQRAARRCRAPGAGRIPAYRRRRASTPRRRDRRRGCWRLPQAQGLRRAQRAKREAPAASPTRW